MPNYKDESNKLYYFSDEDVAAGWPDRSLVPLEPIQDDEARAMLNALFPTPTEAELIRKQIVELESLQTDRRIREAVLGIDNGWLANLNDQIAVLRNKLKTVQ